MAESLDPITGLPKETKSSNSILKKAVESPKPLESAYSTLDPTQLTKPFDISTVLEDKADSKMVKLVDPTEITRDTNFDALQKKIDERIKNEKQKYLTKLDADQGFFGSLGAGLGKFAIKTLAGTGLGLLGTGLGAVKAIFGGGFDALVEENFFTKAEEDIKNWANETMPIYSDNPDYHQLGFFDKLFNEPGKLFGDEVGDAIAFTASAIGQELILSAATAATFGSAAPAQAAASVRLAKRGLSIGKRLMGKVALKSADAVADFAKVTRNMDEAAKLAKFSNTWKNNAGTVAGLAVATHYEAGIEARGTYDAMLNTFRDSYIKQHGKEPSKTELEEAEGLAKDAMWATYGMNAAILSVSNMAQFSSVFSKGYQGFKNAQKAASDVLQDGAKYASKYSAKSKLDNFLTYSYLIGKNPVVEAAEEFGQGAANEGALEYFGRQYSGTHNTGTYEFISAYGKAAQSYFNSTEGGNSMGIGAIVGLLGLPMYSKRSGWSWAGGVAGELSQYKAKVKQAQELVEELNKSDFQTSLKENFKNSVVFSSLAEDMQTAAAHNDAFSFKNYEHDSMFSYMYSRIKMGLKDDVINDIKDVQRMSLEQFNKEFGGELAEEYTENQKQKTISKAVELAERIYEADQAVNNIIEYNLRTVFGKDKLELEKQAHAVKPYMVHAASTLHNLDIREQELTDRLSEISNITPEQIQEMKRNAEITPRMNRVRELFNKEELTEEEKVEKRKLTNDLKVDLNMLQDIRKEKGNISVEDIQSTMQGEFISNQIGVDQNAFMQEAANRINEFAKSSPTTYTINKGEIQATLEDIAKLKNRRETFAKLYDYLATPEGVKKMNDLQEKANEALKEHIANKQKEDARKTAEEATSQDGKEYAERRAAESLGEADDEYNKVINDKKNNARKRSSLQNLPNDPKGVLLERYENSPELFESEKAKFIEFYNSKISEENRNQRLKPNNILTKTPNSFSSWVENMLDGEDLTDAEGRKAIIEFYAGIEDEVSEELSEQFPVYGAEEETVQAPSSPLTNPYINEEYAEPKRLAAKQFENVPKEKGKVWEFQRDANGNLVPTQNAAKVDWNYLNEGNVEVGDTIYYEVDTDEFTQLFYTAPTKDRGALIGNKQEFANRFKIFSYVLDSEGNKKYTGFVQDIKPEDATRYSTNREAQEEAEEIRVTRKQVFEYLQKEGYIDSEGFPTTKKGVVQLPLTSKVSRVGTGRIDIKPQSEPGSIKTAAGEIILGIGKSVNGRPVLYVNNSDITPRVVKGVVPGGVYFMIKAPNGEYLPVPADTRFVNKEEADQIGELLKKGYDEGYEAKTVKPFHEVMKQIQEIVFVDIVPAGQGKKGEYKFKIKFKEKNAEGKNTYSEVMNIEQVKEYLMNNKRVQIPYSKTNTGNYNESIDGDKISTKLNSLKPIHSVTITADKFSFGETKPTPPKGSKPKKVISNVTAPVAVLNTIKEVLQNKEFIKLNKEETAYVDSRTGKEYQRATSFISEGIKESTDLLKSAQTIGTDTDTLVRDFFSGEIQVTEEGIQGDLSKYTVSNKKEVQTFIHQLAAIKEKMDERGETVLANDIVLFDDASGTAGTVDLLTYDVNGDIRIYDMKTMLGNNFENKITPVGGEAITKYDFKGYYSPETKSYIADPTKDSKREYHQKQLSLYRIMLFNTHGLLAKTLGVMPIQVEYKAKDTTTSKLKLLKGVEVSPLDSITSKEGKIASIKKEQSSPKKEDFFGANQDEAGEDIFESTPTPIPTTPVVNTQTKRNRVKNSAKNTKNDLDTPNKKRKLPDFNIQGKWNREKSLAWLKKNLPNVPVSILDDMDAMFETGGPQAWGVFSDAAIYIAENAGTGTAYHEAFHAVFNLYLTEKQRFAILQEAQAITGFTDDIQLEEYLSDKFAEYIVSGKLDSKLKAKTKGFFAKLWDLIKSLLKSSLTIEELFLNINEGKYSNKVIKSTFKGKRYSIPGFTSVKEVRERVDMLNSKVLDKIGELSIEKDTDDIAQIINSHKTAIELEDNQIILKGINAIYGDILLEYITPMLDTYENIADNGYNWSAIKNSEHYQENFNSYEGLEGLSEVILESRYSAFNALNNSFFNEEGDFVLGPLITKAAKHLSRYNIKVKLGNIVKESEALEEDLEKAMAEDSYSFEAWQKARTETSGKETASFYIKHELSKFFEEFTNDKGEILTATDSIGAKKRLDFNKVFNDLKHSITGIYSVEAMMDKILDMAKIKSHYYSIHKKMQEDERFRSAFFHALATSTNNSTLLLKTSDANGNLKYHIIDSNRNSPVRIIRNEWNALYNYNVNSGALTEKRAEVIFDSIEGTINRINTKQSAELSYYDSTKLSELLKQIGIELSSKLLRDYYSKDKAIFVNNFIGPAGLLNTAAVKIKEGKNPFAQGKDSESRGLEPFIKMAVEGNLSLYESAYINVEGKQQFANVAPNYYSRLITELKDKNLGLNIIEEHQQDAFYKNHLWLNELKDKNSRDLLEFTVLDGIKDDTGEAGTRYTKLSPQERLMTDLILFNNEGVTGGSNPNAAKYTMPILADAPQLPIIQFKKYTKEEVIKHLKKVYAQEKARIEKVREDQKTLRKEDLIENYHYSTDTNKYPTWEEQLKGARGLQYHYLTGAQSATDIDSFIQNFLDKEVEKIGRNLKKLKIAFSNTNHILPKSIGDLKTFVELYAANSILANINMMQLFSGDAAFYKSQEDISKRNKQISNPGNILDTTITGETYKTLYLQDEESPSKFLDIYEKALEGHPKAKTIIASYGKVNQTDAQAYISLDRYKKIMKGAGLWTAAHEKAYPNLKSGKATKSELALVLQPVKPFVFSKRMDSRTGHIVPVQNKNSEFVIIPQMKDFAKSEKDKQRIQTILDLFKGDNKVDSIQFESAVKVGGRNQIKFDSISMDNIEVVKQNAEELNNSDYRIQLAVPEHHYDTTILFGTQIRKLAISNINPNTIYDYNGEEKTGAELIKMYQDAITDNIEESHKEVLDFFYNTEEVHKLLMEEIESRGLSQKYKDAIKLDNNGEFSLPLYLPLMSKKMESLLSSVFRNRITKQRIKGGSFVQVSDFTYSDQLKVTSKTTKDGEVVEYMEAMLPWWSKDYFPTNEDGTVDFEKIQRESPEVLELIGFRIPTESKYSFPVLKVVGFTPKEQGGTVVLPADMTTRMGADFDIDKLFIMMPEFEKYKPEIENQSSVEEEYQNYIVTEQFSPKAGKDIVRKDMPDFDDSISRKTFAKAKGYSWNAETSKWEERDYTIKKVESGMNSRAARNNQIMDVIKAIMHNKDHQYEALTPGNFQSLKDFRNKLKDFGVVSKEDVSMILPSSQLELFNRNMAGKDLIGIFANHNTAHTVLQHTNVEFKWERNSQTKIADFVKVIRGGKAIYDSESGEGVNFNKLNRIESPINNELITNALAEFLAASVDNAKDPVLSDLNINTFTADIVAAMVRMGFDLNTALTFINQKVVRDISNRVANGEKADKVIKEIEKSLVVKPRNSNEIHIDIMEAALAGENISPQQEANIFGNFKHMYKFASGLGELTQATRADSKGSSTISANTIFLNRVDELVESNEIGEGVFQEGSLLSLFKGEAYPMLKAFTDLGIRSANENLQKYFPWGNETFKSVVEGLESIKGYPLTEKEMEMVNSHAITYLGSQFDFFKFTDKQASDILSNLPKEFLERKANDEYIKNNAFIQALYHAAPRQDKGEVSARILTNNTARLEDIQKEEIEEAFMEMYNNPEYKEFAENLIKYSFLASGFNFSPISFNNLLPSQVFVEMRNEKGVKLKDFLNLHVEEFNSSKFIELFLKNNHSSLNFTSKISKEKLLANTSIDIQTTQGPRSPIGLVTSFIVPTNSEIQSTYNKPFISIRDGENTFLYEQKSAMSGEGLSYFELVPNLGAKGYYVQYNLDSVTPYLPEHRYTFTGLKNYKNSGFSITLSTIEDLRYQHEKQGFDKMVHGKNDFDNIINGKAIEVFRKPTPVQEPVGEPVDLTPTKVNVVKDVSEDKKKTMEISSIEYKIREYLEENAEIKSLAAFEQRDLSFDELQSIKYNLDKIKELNGEIYRIKGISKPTNTVTEEVETEIATLPVDVIKKYTPAIVRQSKDKIFIFGDNVERTGKGGQAIIRDEENAFGIATKWAPSTADDAYFFDSELQEPEQYIDEDIARIKADGRPVVFPQDGIGTGLSKLKEKAPKVYAYLNQRLMEEFGFNNETGEIVTKNPVENLEKSKESSTFTEADYSISGRHKRVKKSLASIQFNYSTDSGYMGVYISPTKEEELITGATEQDVRSAIVFKFETEDLNPPKKASKEDFFGAKDESEDWSGTNESEIPICPK